MRRLFFILERVLLIALLIGGIAAAIAFVSTFRDDASRPVQANFAAPIAEAAAAASVDGRASQEVITVCHSVPGAAALTICLRSDGSGAMTVNNGVQTSEYVYAFYDDAQGCPNAPEGFVTHNRRMTTHDLGDFGFTQADIETLGLPGRYCAFAAATL